MARPLNENWLPIADEIRAEIGRAEVGEKGAIVRRFAEETGYSKSSLNRDITAAGFIAEVTSEFPGFTADLRKLGSSTVNEVARLFRKNRSSAIKYARSAADGTLTRREIVWERNPRLGRKQRAYQHQELRPKQLEFLEFIKGEAKLPVLRVIDPKPNGLPIVASTPLNIGMGCAAFHTMAKATPSAERLLPYLALLSFYDVVFLGINFPDSHRLGMNVSGT